MFKIIETKTSKLGHAIYEVHEDNLTLEEACENLKELQKWLNKRYTTLFVGKRILVVGCGSTYIIVDNRLKKKEYMFIKKD